MNRLIIATLFVATILLTSTILTQASALSKIEKKILKFYRAETVGGSKMTDLCSATALTENGERNATLKLKDCKVEEEPPVRECNGPNEVWSDEDQDCVCKEGFHQDGTESCVPDVVVPPVTNDTDNQPPVVNETNPPNQNETQPPVTNDTTTPPVTNDTTTPPNDNETAPPHCENNFIFNGTACVPEPQIPTCQTGQFYNTTSEQCQAIPVIEPQPTNTTKEVKIIGVGDVECSGDGVKVRDAIKKENPTIFIALGDLCYDSTASNFISTFGPLGNQLACLIGNHDSEEDGSLNLFQAFQKYCGDNYYVKVGNVLVVGLDTNGDLTKQANGATTLLNNATFMSNFDTVVVASHKPICKAVTGAHHAVDEDAKAKAVKAAFCEPIKNAVGNKADLIFLNGHNHYMVEGKQNGITYVESGAGGKSHYPCSTDAVFTFCNDTKYGYWELTVSSDGTKTTHFKDLNGGILN